MLLALGLASEEFFAVYDKASRGTSSGAALPPVERETPPRWAYTYAAKSCSLLLSHSPVDSMVVALQRATLASARCIFHLSKEYTVLLTHKECFSSSRTKQGPPTSTSTHDQRNYDGSRLYRAL